MARRPLTSPERVRKEMKGKKNGIKLTMIDVMVDVVMFVFDYGLLDDGGRLTNEGTDTARSSAVVLIDISGCESAIEFTFA